MNTGSVPRPETPDERLLRQALAALEGVLAVAAHKGVKPKDVTLTIMQRIRERLAR